MLILQKIFPVLPSAVTCGRVSSKQYINSTFLMNGLPKNIEPIYL